MASRGGNSKPVIGISASVEEIEREPFLGEDRVSLNKDYIRAIARAGGVPMILPSLQEEEDIEVQMRLVDGLLLSGGYDIQPTIYGEEPHLDLGTICPERDEYELKLLRLAVKSHKPILGICRGMQLMNVAFGGTLYQDIAQVPPVGPLLHFQKARPFVASHSVDVVPSTLLHQIFEQETVLTNSFHHQAIKKLAEGFKVNARSKDGLIEGIEGVGDLFLVGVQWHPEKMIDHHPLTMKLFKGFVNQVKNLIKEP